MDDKAQVSMEYLVVILVLLTMAVLLTVFGGNFFGTKQGLTEKVDLFKKEALKMID